MSGFETERRHSVIVGLIQRQLGNTRSGYRLVHRLRVADAMENATEENTESEPAPKTDQWVRLWVTCAIRP